MRMRTLFLFILILLLVTPVFAEEAPKAEPEVAVTEEDPTEEVVVEETPTAQKRISNILENQGGMKEIKPIDLEVLGDKMLELGDSSFAFLQKGSVPLLVWGIGISVVILFFGIFIGRAAVMAGVVGIVISLTGFVIVQFMPETAGSLVQGIGKLFGQ